MNKDIKNIALALAFLLTPIIIGACLAVLSGEYSYVGKIATRMPFNGYLFMGVIGSFGSTILFFIVYGDRFYEA